MMPQKRFIDYFLGVFARVRVHSSSHRSIHAMFCAMFLLSQGIRSYNMIFSARLLFLQ